MNRIDLQLLAMERIADAQALLALGRWSGAYYIAGYAVECALKACIAKRVCAEDFPDKKLANDAHTHDLEKLVRLGELDIDRELRSRMFPAFAANWAVVMGWNETARYRLSTEDESRRLIAAITDPQEGILPWITAHW